MTYDDSAAELRYRKLVELGARATLPELIDALHDENWRVRRCAVELVSTLRPSSELMGALIEVLGQRDQTGARNAAISALTKLGRPAVKPMVALLKHPDPDQRKIAADVLAAVKSVDAVPALLDSLDDIDANVRAAAAEALGQLGTAPAARALERLLGSAEPLLRFAALEGLAALNKPPPLPMLATLLGDPETQRSAYRLAGQVAHPAAFALLCRGLHTSARDAALAGIGAQDKWPAEVESRLLIDLRQVADLTPWLTACLKSVELSVRRGALHAVAIAGLHGLAPAAAAAADGGELAEAVARCLKRLGLKAAQALLEGDPPALVKLSAEARAVAAEHITRIGEPTLVDALARLMAAQDPELSEVAVRGLGRSRTASAIPHLVRALDDDALASSAGRGLARLAVSYATEVRDALHGALAIQPRPHALRTYAQVAPKAALDAVRAATHSPDEHLRAAAAEAASFLSAGEAGELLGGALIDEAASVRRAAAKVLPRLDRGQALALLPRALHDTAPAVVAAACAAAAELGAQGEGRRLLELSASDQPAVVMAALHALSSLGQLPDEVLARACRHDDIEVVKLALQLSASRSEGPVMALGLLTHARWDVRAAAARVLEVAGGTAVLPQLEQALARETDAIPREALVAALTHLNAD